MSYTLLLGDTVDKMRELESESVDLVVTSPPYVGADNLWGDFWKTENFEQANQWLEQIWDESIRVLKSGCKLCINVANTGRLPYRSNHARLYQWAWKHPDQVQPRGDIIWFKQETNRGNTAWGSYRNPSDMHLTDVHEYISIFRKTGERVKSTTRQVIEKMDFLEWRRSVWRIEPESATRVGHIAPFPIEIPKRLITLYSFENETVLDPFVGSGTTIIAAKLLNRNGIGIDHKQECLDLAADRINKTMASLGKEPRRLANGVSISPMFVS